MISILSRAGAQASIFGGDMTKEPIALPSIGQYWQAGMIVTYNNKKQKVKLGREKYNTAEEAKAAAEKYLRGQNNAINF